MMEDKNESIITLINLDEREENTVLDGKDQINTKNISHPSIGGRLIQMSTQKPMLTDVVSKSDIVNRFNEKNISSTHLLICSSVNESLTQDEHTESSKFVDEHLDKFTSKEQTCDFNHEDGFDIIFIRDDAVTKNSYTRYKCDNKNEINNHTTNDDCEDVSRIATVRNSGKTVSRIKDINHLAKKIKYLVESETFNKDMQRDGNMTVPISVDLFIRLWQLLNNFLRLLHSNEDITEEDQLNELMKIYFRVLDKVLVRCKTKDKHSQAPICVAPPTRDMKGHQFPFAVNKAPHAFHMILESPSTKSFHHIGADFQLREVVKKRIKELCSKGVSIMENSIDTIMQELKRLTLESDDQNVSKVVRNALIKLSETESSKTLISMFELIDEFIHEYGLLQNKDGTNDDFICKFCFVKFNADMRSRENFCCDASKQLDKVRKAWKLHDTTNTVVKLDENVFLGMLDSIIKKGAGNIPSETYIRESDKIDDKDDEFLDEKLWNVSPSENKDMRKNFTLLEQKWDTTRRLLKNKNSTASNKNYSSNLKQISSSEKFGNKEETSHIRRESNEILKDTSSVRLSGIEDNTDKNEGNKSWLNNKPVKLNKKYISSQDKEKTLTNIDSIANEINLSPTTENFIDYEEVEDKDEDGDNDDGVDENGDYYYNSNMNWLTSHELESKNEVQKESLKSGPFQNMQIVHDIKTKKNQDSKQNRSFQIDQLKLENESYIIKQEYSNEHEEVDKDEDNSDIDWLNIDETHDKDNIFKRKVSSDKNIRFQERKLLPTPSQEIDTKLEENELHLQSEKIQEITNKASVNNIQSDTPQCIEQQNISDERLELSELEIKGDIERNHTTKLPDPKKTTKGPNIKWEKTIKVKGDVILNKLASGLTEENQEIKEQHEILESRRLPQNFINYLTKTKTVPEMDEYANESSDNTRKKKYKELYDKNNEETKYKPLKQRISLLGRDPASMQRVPESERIFSQKIPRNDSEINDSTQKFVKYTSITPRNVSQHGSENINDSSTKYSEIALANETFFPNFITEKAQGSKQINYSAKKEIGKNEKPKTGRTSLQAIHKDNKATINSQRTNKMTNFESSKKTGLLPISKKVKQYKDYERGTKTNLSEWTPFSESTYKRGTESKRASSKYSSNLQFDKSSNKAFKQQFNAVSEVIMVSQATVNDGFFKGLTQSDNFRVDSEELPPEETSFFPNVVNETFFTKRSKNYPTDQIMKPLNTEFMSHLISIDTYKTVKKRDSKDGVSTKLNGDVKIYNTMKKGQQQSECAAELSNNMGNISLHKTKNLTNMETEIYKSSLQSIKKLGQANPVALHPNKKDAMGYGEDQSDSNLIMFAESEKRSEAKNKHAIGEKGNVKTSSPNLAFSIPMTSLTSVARKTQSARNRQKIHEGATSHVLDPTIWEQREDVSLIMQRYDSSGERKPEFGHGSNVHHGDRISQKVVKGGIISYRLSDPKYLELGWSILPSEKLMRKVVTFQTEPSKPRSVWRTNRAKSETKWYSENKLFSTFDLEGSGKVFYPDGSVAVSLTRSTSGIGRLTVLGHRDPLEKNEKISNVPILAIFDSSGNGIVYNTVGNIRASYTQKEGILLETPNGSPMKWKWPALQGFEDKFEEVLCRHESQDDPHLKDPQSLCESRTYKEAILKSKEQRENVGRNTHDSQTGPNASIHSKKRLHHLDEINYCSRGSKTSHHKVREGSTDRSLKMRLSPSMINDDLFRTHTREDISKISHEDKKEVENTTEIKKNQANGTYTPIKPITLRINEFITFKLMDQANICIDFSANKHFQRLDMGVIVNPSLTNHVDYVDPDLWEKEKIPSPIRHLLGLSPSHDRKIEGKSVLKNKSQEKKHSRQVRELSTSHLNKAVVSVENGLFDLTKSRNSGDLIPPHRTRTLMIEDPKIYNPTKTHIPVIRT